jgi:hypothetical protein
VTRRQILRQDCGVRLTPSRSCRAVQRVVWLRQADVTHKVGPLREWIRQRRRRLGQPLVSGANNSPLLSAVACADCGQRLLVAQPESHSIGLATSTRFCSLLRLGVKQYSRRLRLGVKQYSRRNIGLDYSWLRVCAAIHSYNSGVAYVADQQLCPICSSEVKRIFVPPAFLMASTMSMDC